MTARRWIAAALTAWAVGYSLYLATAHPQLYAAAPRAWWNIVVVEGMDWGSWSVEAATAVVMGCALAGAGGIGWMLWRAMGGGTLPPAVLPGAALALGLAVLVVPLELLAIAHMLTAANILATVGLAAAGCAVAYHRATAPSGAPEVAPTPCGPLLRWGVWSLIAVFTLLSFFHALLYPVTYWDALILYVNYARLIAFEHGFPVMVQSQVGLGLGANYPHLYSLLQACAAIVGDLWSTGYGQVVPPLCGALTTLIVYRLCAERFGSEAVGLLAALLFRAVPYGFFFFVYASDYALAMFIAATVFYLLQRAELRREPAPLAAAGLVVALGLHLNYLMGALCLPFAVVLTWALRRRVVTRRWALIVCALCLALGSTWYLRNWIVAGNPVYAFFSSVFGGKNINPEVLASCEIEWKANGDGIRAYVGPVGDTLANRLLYAAHWLALDRGNERAPGTAYKLAPLLPAFALPGLVWLLIAMRRKPRGGDAAMLLLLAVLMFYQFVLAGYYLYHMLIGLPVLALAAAAALEAMDRGWNARWGRAVVCAAVLVGVYCPGLGCALMGGKFHYPDLPQWRTPGHPPFATLPLVYGEDVFMWRWLNERLAIFEPVILTHENRQLYLDPRIRLLHLDDYRLWDYYDQDFERAVLPRLRELGATHYLRVKNERNHPILRRLGHEAYFSPGGGGRLVAAFGDNELYELP